MAREKGLLMKYFILKPKGNNVYAKASREAMLRYADVVNSINPILTNDLREWVKHEQDLAAKEIYRGEVNKTNE